MHVIPCTTKIRRSMSTCLMSFLPFTCLRSAQQIAALYVNLPHVLCCPSCASRSAPALRIEFVTLFSFFFALKKKWYDDMALSVFSRSAILSARESPDPLCPSELMSCVLCVCPCVAQVRPDDLCVFVHGDRGDTTLLALSTSS